MDKCKGHGEAGGVYWKSSCLRLTSDPRGPRAGSSQSPVPLHSKPLAIHGIEARRVLVSMTSRNRCCNYLQKQERDGLWVVASFQEGAPSKGDFYCCNPLGSSASIDHFYFQPLSTQMALGLESCLYLQLRCSYWDLTMNASKEQRIVVSYFICPLLKLIRKPTQTQREAMLKDFTYIHAYIDRYMFS